MGERVAFGPYLFDTTTSTLQRGDDLVPLGGRAAGVLQALLEANGEVIAKSKLLDTVWPGTTVEEGNLAVQVATLRKTLGTRPDGGEWIGTVARVGYRLHRDGGTEQAGLPVIAVLPFANLSGNRGQDYFVDGIVDDLITALSRFKTFVVVSRNSAFAFKDRAVDVREVSRTLGARYLLEGSVRRAGSQVRVSAQLVEGTSGVGLWAQNFDGSVEDVFDFQDRIAESVVGLIEPQIRAAEVLRSRRKRPDSLDAYDLYLRALPSVLHGTGIVRAEQFNEAIDMLARAIAIDATFAPALGLAAWAHETRLTRGGVAPDGVDDAKLVVSLAERALAADGNDGIILAIAGIVRLTIEGEVRSGLALLRRARGLNPNSLLIANLAGYAYFFCGQYDEAIECHARFLQLAPGLSDTFWSLTGTARCHLAAGRTEEALTWGLRALEAYEGVDFTHCVTAAAYAHLGQLEKAAAVLERALAIWPNLTISSLLGLTGQPEGRDRVLVAGLRIAGMPEGETLALRTFHNG